MPRTVSRKGSVLGIENDSNTTADEELLEVRMGKPFVEGEEDWALMEQVAAGEGGYQRCGAPF